MSKKNNDERSDIDEEEKRSIQKDAEKNFVNTDFMEKIVKYIKTDDLIRQETMEYKEKINTLKDEKVELETCILKYLDNMDNDIINVGGKGTIKKYESVRKSGINKDIIKQSICEQLKKENIVKDDKKAKELAELTYDMMESKREKKTKVCLKRVMERKKKEKPEKKDVSDAKKPKKNNKKK